ncbi:hypothetical protein AAVH_04487 [Aphelenchoides avenae]|nr:hypothetical protein AAVH_04487 [Aphelenchus avenae]
MRVPERITVVGGEGHRVGPSQPMEILSDKLNPPIPTESSVAVPEIITANELPYPPYPEGEPRPHYSAQKEEDSQSSIMVDENPLRELKVMRRQLGRLATRVGELEDENARRSTREMFYVVIGAVIVIVSAFRRTLRLW